MSDFELEDESRGILTNLSLALFFFLARFQLITCAWNPFKDETSTLNSTFFFLQISWKEKSNYKMYKLASCKLKIKQKTWILMFGHVQSIAVQSSAVHSSAAQCSALLCQKKTNRCRCIFVTSRTWTQIFKWCTTGLRNGVCGVKQWRMAAERGGGLGGGGGSASIWKER